MGSLVDMINESTLIDFLLSDEPNHTNSFISLSSFAFETSQDPFKPLKKREKLRRQQKVDKTLLIDLEHLICMPVDVKQKRLKCSRQQRNVDGGKPRKKKVKDCPKESETENLGSVERKKKKNFDKDEHVVVVPNRSEPDKTKKQKKRGKNDINNERMEECTEPKIVKSRKDATTQKKHPKASKPVPNKKQPKPKDATTSSSQKRNSCGARKNLSKNRKTTEN